MDPAQPSQRVARRAVAMRLHILRTVTLTREFVSSRVPDSINRACQTPAGTYAPSPTTHEATFRVAHLLRICDCAALHRHHAVLHGHYATPLHTTDARHCVGAPLRRTSRKSASDPIRPPLLCAPILRWDRIFPQTPTSRCRSTSIAHHRPCSAHERGASSLGEDNSIPHARCNVKCSL
jgi:hypothetical protein